MPGTIESVLSDTEFMKADEKFRRAFAKSTFYHEVFEKKMASSLEASAIIEIYTLHQCIWALEACLNSNIRKRREI